jgi:RNA polymerase sigma factor (sigma-70 family)
MRTEDGNIVHQCLNGEPGAFGMLVDKYKEGIYAFAYDKLRDFQDAQDVTQEVFLQAYRGLRTLRRWESLAFWLYRIAYARCTDLLRIRSKRVDRDFVEDQDPQVIDAHSLDSYRRDQRDESLQGALDSLPDAYREVLVLHYFGGMTIKDMAKALGASPGAIGMRLSRARAQLREEMIAMMDTTFESQRLPTGFTFRIVEAVKRIKIDPMPRMGGLPWGLSLAAGIVAAVLSLNPHVSITNDVSIPTGSPLPGQTRALKAGEIPVDIMEVSDVPFIANRQADSNGGELKPPDPQNAAVMAAPGAANTWTEGTDLPTARTRVSTSVVDGIIYAIGGFQNGSGVGLPTVEAYDPANDKWEQKADMPVGISFHTASVVDGRIYVIGGQEAGGDWGDPCRETVAVYDPARDTWEEMNGTMPSPRADHSASVVDGIIYTFGGTAFPPGTQEGLDIVEAYDPIKDSWTTKADIPTARMCLSTSAIGGRIYAIGGEASYLGVILPTVEIYDTGFVPPAQGSSVRPKGKILSTWGETKSH